MKIIAILVVLLVISVSCIDNRAPSGISGTVLYGEGDCMPPINESTRKYNPYTGKVWIIDKTLADTMNFIQFDSTNAMMISTLAQDGSFSLLVPPGTYYIMVDSLFYISSENVVILKPDDLIEREFRFFRCLTY